MTGNTWEARQQDDETARQRDCGTTGQRDDETTRQRDDETTGRRDHKKKARASPAISRSPEVPKSRKKKAQAFSVILSRSQSCVAVRGSLASEWCRCVLSQKRVPWDSTKTYSPRHSTFWDRTLMRRYHAKRLLQVHLLNQSLSLRLMTAEVLVKRHRMLVTALLQHLVAEL